MPMLKPIAEITVCVVDYGSFIHVAQRMSRDCKKVYWCNPSWQHSYPTWNEYIVGRDVEGIERIDSIWSVFDEIDLFVFPDLYQGELQEWLRSKGKAVYGAGTGEDMEIYRDEFKEVMEDAGMDMSPYEAIEGLDKLRKYLESVEDVYIKTNVVRGNMETFHWDSMKLSKPILDEMEHSMGIFKNEQLFIVEQPIKDAVEYGGEWFVVGDRYADRCTVGIESKDASYACKMVTTSEIPKGLKKINSQLAAKFGFFGYKGQYSNEVKVTKGGKNFLLDMTCRCGEPNTSIQEELITNYSDVLWHIANGLLPNIETANGEYGVEIIIKSDWATEECQPIYFPRKYANYVKIKNVVIQDDVCYYVPTRHIPMKEIGAVVGTGRSLKDAIKMATEVAESIEGYCLKIDTSALDDIVGEIEKLQTFGINLF